MTIAPEIAEAISKAYADLHLSFQKLEERCTDLETELKKLGKSDSENAIALNKSSERLEASADALSNFTKVSSELLALHDRTIQRLETEIKDLKSKIN